MAGPFWSHQGEGHRTEFGGLTSFIRATGDDTGGLFSVTETTMTQGGGPPLHVHEREDEALVVLEGEYEVTVGSDTFTATPGAFVFAPRGIPHVLRARSGAARHVTIISPPGYERFFPDMVEAGSKGPEAVAEVVARYGVKLLETPPGGNA